MNNLQFYYKPLKRVFKNDLKSAYINNGGARTFIGYEIYSPSIMSHIDVVKIKEIIGDGYRVYFLPNDEKIIIG